jgi:hypothetical protein
MRAGTYLIEGGGLGFVWGKRLGFVRERRRGVRVAFEPSASDLTSGGGRRPENGQHRGTRGQERSQGHEGDKATIFGNTTRET